MKLHRETVHTPEGTLSHRLYECGPFSIYTFPGFGFRGQPVMQRYKGINERLNRHEAACLLAAIRELHHYAP